MINKVPKVPRVPKVPKVLWALFAMVFVLLTQSRPVAQQLPAGAGLEVLNRRCVSCHESDIITSQKLSLTGWTRSVDKMVRWGASITPEEREILQAYLAQHFAPKPVASHPATDTGAATFTRVCLTCHEADIIEQQKLTPTGWTRSVEKMMRWGARISDADKQPLVDYLAARYGPP
jgi:mono/diheme cytochrome c family protein